MVGAWHRPSPTLTAQQALHNVSADGAACRPQRRAPPSPSIVGYGMQQFQRTPPRKIGTFLAVFERPPTSHKRSLRQLIGTDETLDILRADQGNCHRLRTSRSRDGSNPARRSRSLVDCDALSTTSAFDVPTPGPGERSPTMPSEVARLVQDERSWTVTTNVAFLRRNGNVVAWMTSPPVPHAARWQRNACHDS